MDQKIVALLKEIEKTGDQFWNVPVTTGKFLNMLVKIKQARNVLEIGTSNGYSGIFFAEALSFTKGKLYTVESHKERFLLAKNNFERSGLSEYIEQISGHAPEILSTLDQTFDVIFLDATKMEYKSYAEVLLPKLNVGGVMVADNVSSHASEMKSYFEFMDKSSNVENVMLPFDNGLLLSYKIS